MNVQRVGWMMIALGVATVRAEDLTTLTGETYADITVQRHDQRGLQIRHSGGDAIVLYRDILPELREYYKKMAVDLTPEKGTTVEKEPPAGPSDLPTRSGRIYRNIVVKKVEPYAVHFNHDGGSAKVYFTDIPDKPARDRVRTATPVPDDPPGPEDVVSTDGQVFRKVEVLRTEPDGLTFRHAGGTTKLRFVSLPDAMRNQYGYDPKAAAKYQRDQSEDKKRAKEEESFRRALNKFEPQDDAPGVAEPVSVSSVKTYKAGQGEYRVSFSIKNNTDQQLSIRVISYDQKMKALMGGKKFRIPAGSQGEPLEITVPLVQPKELRVYCGEFQTNRVLRW